MSSCDFYPGNIKGSVLEKWKSKGWNKIELLSTTESIWFILYTPFYSSGTLAFNSFRFATHLKIVT